jgi:hypothetical protein
MPTITTRIESARGCGYKRKGLYLVSSKVWFSCGKLPIELNTCPCCNQGIKFTRGFTWIGKALIADAPCSKLSKLISECTKCSPWYNDDVKRLGLLWVGEKFYPRPADFIKEVNAAGISKRIHQIPKDLVLGETWVMLAHNKAIPVYYDEEGKALAEPTYKRGIFAAFIPECVEYVVGGDETDEELEALEKKGYKLIDVIKDVNSQIPIDKQLDEYEIEYFKAGDRNRLNETFKANSEKAARQMFKETMKGIKTRIMSVEKV